MYYAGPLIATNIASAFMKFQDWSQQTRNYSTILLTNIEVLCTVSISKLAQLPTVFYFTGLNTYLTVVNSEFRSDFSNVFLLTSAFHSELNFTKIKIHQNQFFNFLNFANQGGGRGILIVNELTELKSSNSCCLCPFNFE